MILIAILLVLIGILGRGAWHAFVLSIMENLTTLFTGSRVGP
jgi:hypothetical protein